MAAGGAAMVCGLAIPEPDLVRVGALLIILPLVSALIARRSRYRLSCSRRLDPPRVPAGHPTTVTARLENVSRLRTAMLLAEDVTPYSLGSRPRFVLDEIEPGGHRELTYQIRSEARGKFTIGPLRIRVADAFGLVEITKSFSSTSTLVVTPRIYDLPRAAAPSSWLGEGDGGMRTISAIGEDDAAPRRLPGRGRAAPGALEVDRAVRRADGAPRGTPVAQQRVRLPRHAPQRAFGRRHLRHVRVRRERGGLDRRAPVRRGVPGQAHHRRRGDRPARHVPGHPARHARGHQPLAGRRVRARAPPRWPTRAGRSSPCWGACPPTTPGCWPRAGAGTRPRWRWCWPFPAGRRTW